MKSRNNLGIAAGLLAAALALGCDSSGPTSPGSAFSGMGPRSSGTGASYGALTAEVAAAMERAIQDEYHAEEIYSLVLEDFGNVLPFANVVNAEARHSESIARLYSNREIAAPASLWSRDNVPRFGSVPAACAAAVVEEEKNIAMYDELLRAELPVDVRNVFSSNREASLSSHLPAFRLCAR